MQSSPERRAQGAREDEFTKTVNLREFKAGGKQDGENDPDQTVRLNAFTPPTTDAVEEEGFSNDIVIGLNKQEVFRAVKGAMDGHVKKYLDKIAQEGLTPNDRKNAKIDMYNNLAEELGVMVKSQQLTESEMAVALADFEKRMVSLQG